jgi:protein SCO1
MRFATCSFFLISSFFCASVGFADYDTSNNNLKLKADETPAELKDVGISEKLGEAIDMSLPFVNEEGKAVRLGDYFTTSRPVILSLVYYGCGNLCNYHLNGLVDGLKAAKEEPGKDYEVVAISFDDKDTPAIATKKKSAYMKQLGRVGAENSFHFLTGDKASLTKISSAIGFKYKWNESEKQWAHASAAVFVTPEGKISRYLHGVFFDPGTLKLAITESSQLKISNIINTFVLYCFKYDPQKSRYIIAAANIMKVGGLITMGILFYFLSKFWRRQRSTLLNQGEV